MLKVALYRTRQYIFSIFVKIVQNKKTELIRKENALLDLPNILLEKNINNIFVATTPGFIKRKTLEPFFKALDEKNITYTIFTDIEPDPTVKNVEDGVIAYNNANAKGIVAIGGGSVLDCAKIIGARVSNPKRSVRKLRGMLKVKKAIPPYFPIPTTCGTGSEVTAAAVIADDINNMHYKYAVTDLKLIPKVAILDPNLLVSLPDNMILTTTMDALTHSLEAYLNLFPSKVVKKDSKESIKLIFDNLDDAIKTRNINSLDKLLYASTLAGVAITHNFVGYVHSIAHAIGAIYHLPHGYLNSIILPVILKKYEKKIEKKMKVLCEYTNTPITTSYTDSIINKINEFKKIGSIPNYIKELKEEDFDEIIKRAYKEGNPTYPVPKVFSKKDFKDTLYELLTK